jgi:F420H(2)-dependent quinone reductase
MTRGDFTRWLYRGGRPNWIARAMNRMGAAIASMGVTSNIMLTLETTGRTSGRTITQPMVVAVVDMQRYLVSMLGENVNWVKNVRAAGGKAAFRSGSREEFLLEEVPIDQRTPILKAYLRRAPGARPHIPVDKDASLADFEKVVADFPVFRVVSLKKG